MKLDQQAFDAALLQERAGLDLSFSPKSIVFDPDLHPRDPLGHFIGTVGSLKPGQKATLPDKVTVKKNTSGGGFRVSPTGKFHGSSFSHAADTKAEAARQAFDLTAQNEHPDSLGGNAHYRSHTEALDALKTGTVKDQHFHPARGQDMGKAQKELDRKKSEGFSKLVQQGHKEHGPVVQVNRYGETQKPSTQKEWEATRDKAIAEGKSTAEAVRIASAPPHESPAAPTAASIGGKDASKMTDAEKVKAFEIMHGRPPTDKEKKKAGLKLDQDFDEDAFMVALADEAKERGLDLTALITRAKESISGYNASKKTSSSSSSASSKTSTESNPEFNAKHKRGFGGKFIRGGGSGAPTPVVKGIAHKLGAKNGNLSTEGIENFQKSHGLTVDGIIGHQTATALLGGGKTEVGALTKHDKRRLFITFKGK